MNAALNQNLPPSILAVTPRWVIVSKPPHWLTIPGRAPDSQRISKDSKPCLLEWLKQDQQLPVYVVHRIDRETSGVVLFARTKQDHQIASLWFQKRQTKKTYYCLASGTPQAPILKIQLPIRGRASTTQIEIKESFRQGFFAQVTPLTGRRHQIRIHLAEKGFPIWGDSLYQGLREIHFKHINLNIDRVALHAYSLTLPTGERFEAQLPDDMKTWLETLKREGPK